MSLRRFIHLSLVVVRQASTHTRYPDNNCSPLQNSAIDIERGPGNIDVLGTIKALSCSWMAGKKEFSAVVVKCFQEFFPDISGA